MNGEARGTVADPHKIEGQAELINGRIVRLPGHGALISRVSMVIGLSPHEYEERIGVGEVHTATLGCAVPMLASGREPFCADVSYYIGPPPSHPMAFVDGPPTFAVEIRDEQDYGPEAEVAMAARRADYFEAGTLVVCDVDAPGGLIHAYRPEEAALAITFAKGRVIDAEPAVPGWSMAVGEIFGEGSLD